MHTGYPKELFDFRNLGCKHCMEDLQGAPKTPQTIENNLLLEFQSPSTNLKVRMQNIDRMHIFSIDLLRN